MKNKSIKLKFAYCIYACMIAMLCPISLFSEIQQVTIKWIPMQCQASCMKGLEAAFRKIPGVTAINMNQPGGQAELQWRPNAILAMGPINAAMSSIGLSIEDIRVRVRGSIVHDDRDVYIVSLGDSTMFKLMGPLVPKPNQYTMNSSVYNRPLSPQMRDELLQAQADGKLAVLTGPLFESERSPPIMVIVESLRYVREEERR